MNENTKKILIYSGIGVGVIIAFYAGSVILTRITQRLKELKEQGQGSVIGGITQPEMQPTISSDQANSIANQVFDQIDGANVFSGVDDTIKILSPIQNIKDWELVKNSFGVKNVGSATYFTNDYIGDISGALNWEYSGYDSDLEKLRNFFATKGITNAL
jgi:hypothetical protein